MPRCVPVSCVVFRVLFVVLVVLGCPVLAASLLRQRDPARHPLAQPLHTTRAVAVVELRRVLHVLLGTGSRDGAGLTPEVLGLSRRQVVPDRCDRVDPRIHCWLERARPDLVPAVVRVEQVAVAVEEGPTEPDALRDGRGAAPLSVRARAATRCTISFATATLRSRSGTNMHGSSATIACDGTAL